VKAGVVGGQIQKAARKQQRSDKQHQRERDLGDNQKTAQSESHRARGRAAAGGLQSRARRDSCASKSRREAEEDAGGGRGTRRKSDRSPIQAQREKHRAGLGGKELQQEFAQDRRHPHPECRPGAREQHAFGQ